MEVFKTSHNAASYIAKKLIFKIWQDRIADMLNFVCLKPSTDNSTPIAMYRIKIDRVAKDWPQNGSIYVTRCDGIKFRLYMKNREFKVERI